MSPLIIPRHEYLRLKKIADKLRYGVITDDNFYSLLNIYKDDIIKKIQHLQLDETINTEIQQQDYQDKLYQDLIYTAISLFSDRKKDYEHMNEEQLFLHLQKEPQNLLYFWKNVVYAYIQKCHFYGIKPDMSHLIFFEKPKESDTDKPRKSKSKKTNK